MLGDIIMHTPILTENLKKRSVYFPIYNNNI